MINGWDFLINMNTYSQFRKFEHIHQLLVVSTSLQLYKLNLAAILTFSFMNVRIRTSYGL
uniref:Uncharacterized protein n=1 Tax=Candidatus Berkiella cookevillensis TaxID=437022 RepID=A0A0Q9YHA9_9GAMM